MLVEFSTHTHAFGQFVKQEDLSKYRCKVPECAKLFKGVDFWRKHVEKRHLEWYDRVRQDVELVNTYVLDPAHIAPSRSDANSNGHFPLGNSVPTGTPRGFQLQQHMAPMGFPMTAGMPPNAMQQIFAGGMPAGWNPAVGMPGMPGMPGMQGGVGPMRNHGRQGMMNGFGGGGARMQGPYARNDGRGRMPSMSGGRPGGMPMMTGLPGVGLEGGAGAIGPQEAVQGRSLRSYEDLDASGDKGTGELDY